MNRYVYSLADGTPRYYLSDEGDYGFELNGQPAFYIDSGQVYGCDGALLYYISGGYFCDAHGAVLYLDEHDAPVG
jgi:hypothetical protein